MNKAILVLFTAVLVSLSGFSQSKEQREAANKWPLTFKVAAGKNESKSHKDTKGKSSGRSSTQVKTTERKMNWTAKVDCRSTNFTEKVEIKAYYIGTEDGDFAIIGTDKYPVQFDEKGRATVELSSPTAKLVKTTKRTGGRRGRMEKEVKGERINGLVAQLVVNGTIVKTFTSQPSWAKGAWASDLSEADLRPGAGKK